MPWWNFVDWTRPWPRGVPPGASEPEGAPGDIRGGSAALDLQLLLAYEEAADLEQAVGSPARADELRATARRLRAAIQARVLGRGPRPLRRHRGPRSRSRSTRTCWPCWPGWSKGRTRARVMDRVLGDSTLTPPSIYFRHYLHAALNRTGQGDRYLDAARSLARDAGRAA